MFNVSKIEHHYLHSRFFNNDDIAIIKLSTHVKFSNKVSTICLPDLNAKTSDLMNKDVVTIGW